MTHKQHIAADRIRAGKPTPAQPARCKKPFLVSFRPRFRFDDSLEIVEANGWRAQFKFAMDETGDTQTSLAHALGRPQQHISRLLDPAHKKALTIDWLEQMRDRAPDVFKWLIWLLTEPSRERELRRRAG